MENIGAMLVQDVAWSEICNHVEESKLMLVDKGSGGQGAREKVEGWCWSPGMETLESLQGESPVSGENLHLCRGEEERGESTEKLWCRVGGLHPQASGRISSVVSGHPTGNHRI